MNPIEVFHSLKEKPDGIPEDVMSRARQFAIEYAHYVAAISPSELLSYLHRDYILGKMNEYNEITPISDYGY